MTQAPVTVRLTGAQAVLTVRALTSYLHEVEGLLEVHPSYGREAAVLQRALDRFPAAVRQAARADDLEEAGYEADARLLREREE